MHIFTQMKNFKDFFDAVDKSQSVPDSCPYRADVMPVIFPYPVHQWNARFRAAPCQNP
mgnify:CR=1 FL=1